MKLENLLKEGNKETILLKGEEVEVVMYVPLSIKEALINEIITYIFSIEYDENNKIVSVQPTHDEFLKRILEGYMITKNYLIGIEPIKDENDEDDYIATYDAMVASGLLSEAICEMSDISEFSYLLDNKIGQLNKFANTSRMDSLIVGLQSLTESVDTIIGDLIVKNKLDLDLMEKQVSSMPDSKEEFMNAMIDLAKIAGVDEVKDIAEKIKPE